MSNSSTHILKKIFVQGFYRENSGMFIFLFTSIFSSCFFVNTLGELPPGTYFFWHFVITITLVSNPLMITLFIILSIFYAFKNLQYIKSNLQKSNNQFLFYSINASDKGKQFREWFAVEFYIFLPLIIYTLFSVVIGFITHNYIKPILIVIFIFLLAIACATNITAVLNRFNNNKISIFNKLFRQRKPFFTLYTYYVLHKLKAVYLITKIASFALIFIIFYNYPELKNDLKTSYLVVLLMITSHIVLIYQEQIFNNRYLSFSYNFPFSKTKLFFGFTINYILILLPEIIWLFSYFNLSNAFVLAISGISVLLLFRSIACVDELKMFPFLKIIFLVLCILYLIVSFDFYYLILPVCLLLSYIIFYKNYFYKNIG